MNIKIQTAPRKYVTNIKHYKNSVSYTKRNIENNKKVSSLTVYTSGYKKGKYIFHSYENNGDITTIKYDPEISARSLYSKKQGQEETLLQTLYKGIPGIYEWHLDLFNSTGQRIKQIVKFPKGISEKNF